jgi:hypothetical protein
VGILNCGVLRRIHWIARTLQETAEAISLVSHPLISNVLIKRCYAASTYDAMIVPDMNQLTQAGWERKERGAVAAGTLLCRVHQARVHSHNVRKWLPLKTIN